MLVCSDDSTRVKLSCVDDDPCSDYVNASYIPVRSTTTHSTETNATEKKRLVLATAQDENINGVLMAK